jgi:hypothetical protein
MIGIICPSLIPFNIISACVGMCAFNESHKMIKCPDNLIRLLIKKVLIEISPKNEQPITTGLRAHIKSM